MKLRIKLVNLNRPNLNNVIYTKDCFEKIKSQLAENSVPVKTISDDCCIDDIAPIGMAKLDSSLYPELNFIANLHDTQCVQKCIERGLGGFGLCGLVQISGRNDVKHDKQIQVVSELTHISIGYTLSPASSSRYEIIDNQ